MRACVRACDTMTGSPNLRFKDEQLSFNTHNLIMAYDQLEEEDDA